MIDADYHIKEYEKNKDQYASFEDYLGSNGLQQCDICHRIVEYDEIEEDGVCMSCLEEE